jgi:hypothetical protein
MAWTSYNTEDVIVRAQVMNAAKYAAGTYKKGQLLGRLTANGVFTPYTSGVTTGAEIIAAVCPVDITIDTVVTTAPVARGEFSRAGVAAVMASLGTPVALTDALIGQCWDAGIILN